MSCRFMDGFDHYATADITGKWNSLSGTTTPIISAGNGRRGGQCMRCPATSGTGGQATKTIDAQATWIVGFGFRLASGPFLTVSSLVQFLDAGTLQCDLRVNADGTLSVTRNGTSVTGGTSVLALSVGVYAYIEMKVTIADSIAANSCKVRVNGVDWITVTTGQDLKNTANATANQIRIGPNSNTSAMGPFDFDDLYILDGVDSTVSGNANNDFLGDVAVVPLYPSSAGNHTQWTPDSGSNYARVNELVADGDSSYVETTSAGNIDSYAFQSLSGTPSNIYAVGWNVEARKTDASTYKLRSVYRTGGTDYVSSVDQSLGTTYAFYQEILQAKPSSGAAWAAADLVAPEFGVKLNSVV